MFSNNKNRKLKAPTEAKDLFSAFASSSKVSVKTVVKPRPAPPAPTPIITTTHAPRTSSPLSVPSKSIPRPPSSASSSRPSTPTPQSPAKRKRAPPEDRDELDTVKKPRRSVPRDSVDRASSSSPAPSRGPRSSTPRSVVVPFGSVDKAIPRPLVVSQQDGNVVHVSSEDVITRMMADVSSGKKNKTSYVAFFKNPSDPEDKSFEPLPTPPVVELEYPNIGASERYTLLYPTDKEDYQPIRELIRTIGIISEFYLTPAQRQPLGQLSSSHSLAFMSSAPAAPSLHASPSPSRPMSPAFINNSIPSPTPEPHSDPLLRTLEKAHNTRNGPLFVKTVEAISEYFRSMKLEMRANAEAWYNAPSPSPTSTPNGKGKGRDRSEDESTPSIVVTPEKSNDGYQGAGISGGVPPKLWRAITEEVYQRAVGPDIEDTKKYRSFSSETYGELNAIFISDLIHRFGLGPGRTFVDLGSGVGNCVIQAALQAGCDSYGIELNAPVAALSFTQQREFHARLRMWGLTAGSVTLLEGDFTESPEVCEWIRKADVVLVNNYIFSADLNEKLTWRFLDLRDGAKVVVLKPFWPLNRPLTERTAYTPEAVLSSGVQRMEYIKDSVSWTQEPGEFYIYTKSEGRAVIPSESGRSSSRRGGRQFS